TGDIYVLSDSKDIIIVYNGRSDKLINDCINQIQYLLSEDIFHLSSNKSAITDHYSIYKHDSWHDFVYLCETKCNAISKKRPANQNLSSSALSIITGAIEEFLCHIDWDIIVKTRSVYRLSQTKNTTPIINELCVDVNAVKYILGDNFDVFSNPYIKNFVHEFFDWHVLIALIRLLENEMNIAYMINLKLSTLMTEEFKAFNNNLSEGQRKKIIIAIDVSDIFLNMHNFLDIREQLSQDGFKLCIDNLDLFSFMHIDRNALGFDLVRILNYSSTLDLEAIESIATQLSEKIASCGSSRVILDIDSDTNETLCRKLNAHLYMS
ncbi:MAG: hypothetical protein ACK5WS_01335, partial [Alphaproteobacteria bacterium]